MRLIDSHCHIDANEFDSDRSQVIERAIANGVHGLVVPGITAELWPGLIRMCAINSTLFPALGLHPVYIHQHKPIDLQTLSDLLSQYKPLAVGEIGLDFFIKQTDRIKQIEYFEAQLQLAIQHNLPVILHVRKAHDQVLQSLKKHRVKGGICHAFNGSLQQAYQYIEMGFKLGFGGMLTYVRSNKIRRLAVELPLQSLVLETDAPDMTVSSHHGLRNSPEYLPECLQALANLRNQTPEMVAEACTNNTLSVLNFSDHDRLHITMSDQHSL